MKEKCKLYFVFYDHKLCKVNLINAIVCKKSSFKVDIRKNKKICYGVKGFLDLKILKYRKLPNENIGGFEQIIGDLINTLFHSSIC